MRGTETSELTLLFLVGMPRSGTKLLRDLLSRHPEVALFPQETHFIPFFHRRFARYGDVSRRAGFSRFFIDFQTTTFYRRMRARGIVFDEARWFERLAGRDYRDVLLALFAYYREQTGSRIVGDKSPDYITQVPLLSSFFPDAKFIHITRDPRDHVLSMRRAWGKSVPRSAQRWKEQIRKYQSDVARCGVKCADVKYEDLLALPQETLARLCRFLSLEFDSRMLSLGAPSENLGDTRGMQTIVRENIGKWRSQLERSEVEEVESIVGNLMLELGYPVASHAGDENISGVRMWFYRLLDATNMFRFRMRDEGGILPALAQSYRDATHSGLDE